MTRATELIAAERHRQIHTEGYDAEHDTGHLLDLVRAAESYSRSALVEHARAQGAFMEDPPNPMSTWPWALEYWKPTGDVVRDLTKAGALIAAAIDAELAARPEEDR